MPTLRGSLDPVLVSGTVISVAAGLVSYVGGDRNIVLGVVVGLQGQTITLLVDVLIRLSDREHQLGRSGELLSKIESIKWFPEVVNRLAGEIIRVEVQYRGTIAPVALKKVLDDCERELRDLARGHLYVESYDVSLKLELLAAKSGRLLTTSVQDRDFRWHTSDVGRAYWNAQQKALEDGWEIARIFIYDDWTSDLSDLAAMQKSHGVRVKRVLRTSLPEAMRIDFTLWNDTHGFQQWFRETESSVLDRFTVDAHDIHRYHQMWRLIDALSDDV